MRSASERVKLVKKSQWELQQSVIDDCMNTRRAQEHIRHGPLAGMMEDHCRSLGVVLTLCELIRFL